MELLPCIEKKDVDVTYVSRLKEIVDDGGDFGFDSVTDKIPTTEASGASTFGCKPSK